MKAAVLTDIRKVEIRDVSAPRVETPEQVLLRVATVGVCGSDMHYYRSGRIGSQIVQFPWITGHECACTVVEVGAEVKDLRAGDRVAVDPLIACRRCDQCLRGRENTCRNQKFLGCPGQVEGALCEFLVMPARNCFAIPETMSFAQATLAEPFAIGMHAVNLWKNATHATPCVGFGMESRIAILGCGPIGLSVLSALLTLCDRKPGTVCVSDLRDNRLELAKTLGAAWTGNARAPRAAGSLEAQAPLGFDVVFECAGEQETLDQAVEVLAPGGTLVIAGIPEGERVSFKTDLMRRKELRVQNVRRQNDCTRHAIDLIGTGKVNLDPLVTHEFPLDRSAEAFAMVADYRDGVVKAMIHV